MTQRREQALRVKKNKAISAPATMRSRDAGPGRSESQPAERGETVRTDRDANPEFRPPTCDMVCDNAGHWRIIRGCIQY